MRAPLSSSLASERELRAARNKRFHHPFLFSLAVPNFSGSHYLREAVQNYQVTANTGALTEYKPIKTTPSVVQREAHKC